MGGWSVLPLIWVHWMLHVVSCHFWQKISVHSFACTEIVATALCRIQNGIANLMLAYSTFKDEKANEPLMLWVTLFGSSNGLAKVDVGIELASVAPSCPWVCKMVCDLLLVNKCLRWWWCPVNQQMHVEIYCIWIVAHQWFVWVVSARSCRWQAVLFYNFLF